MQLDSQKGLPAFTSVNPWNGLGRDNTAERDNKKKLDCDSDIKQDPFIIIYKNKTTRLLMVCEKSSSQCRINHRRSWPLSRLHDASNRRRGDLDQLLLLSA